ncbi:MAG: rod shape-determining protein MreD [Lautropia sp.]|nr:rod shape-determining protein MreD [Lautropia sp.]
MSSPVPSPHAFPWLRASISLLLATLLNLAPWGQSPVVPDFLMLVLTWWALQQPHRTLLVTGFLLGLLIDTHQGNVLGEHSLLYTVAVWMTLQFQRRITWFRQGGQMLHILGVMLVAQAALSGARLLMRQPLPGPEQGLTWLSTTLLWPLADLLLPARAQRRQPAGTRPASAPFVDLADLDAPATPEPMLATEPAIYADADVDDHTHQPMDMSSAQPDSQPSWIAPEDLLASASAPGDAPHTSQASGRPASTRPPAYWHYQPDERAY